MYKVNRSDLSAFLAAVAAAEKLYLPVDDGKGGACYAPWSEGVEYSTATNTGRSAKDFFFPQTEDLVAFKRDGKMIEIIDMREECEDFVVFGVRACDVQSFAILDRVFLVDPIDTYYQNRREHATIISMACSAPDETCFCGAFGIDAAAPAGDIRAWLTDDALLLEVLTEKGEALMAKLGALATACDDSAADAAKAASREALEALPLAGLKTTDFTADQLKAFNSDAWKGLSEACLGCGSCTFACPTCQCYDIRDYDTGHGIQRYRCWDSCMYSDFTLMASGTPRLTQLEKFRQRFMHKLVYFPMNNEGIYGCVGCGRCLQKCPISMNIVKVMKKLGEDAE